MSNLGILAFGAGAAGIVTSAYFTFILSPGIFKLVPPDAAGRLFHKIGRAAIFVAFACAAAAAALQAFDSPLKPAVLGANAAAAGVLFAAFSTFPAFERARSSALREPGLGNPVDGEATLRSHRLLAGIRGEALLAAALLTAGAFASIL